MALRTEHLVVEADLPDMDDVPIAVLFNPYHGPCGIYSIVIKPFPWESYPPHSPWEDNVVIGWNRAAEQVAQNSGHGSVEAYVKSEIRRAVAMHQQGKGAGV